MRTILAALALVACSDAPTVPDAGVPDGPADAPSARDAWVEPPEPRPVCPPEASPVTPPVCGTGAPPPGSLLPGPGDPAVGAGLAALARRFDRQFHVLNAHGTGGSTDAVVPLDAAAARAALDTFLRTDDGWDLVAATGLGAPDIVSSWSFVTGAFAGPAMVADAYRYGLLRDTGGDCAELSVARDHLLADLELLHLAVAITGVPGVIARGVARTDQPGIGAGVTTTPLFDAAGNPLPPVKDNGTWRADNSGGLYPNWVWVDSASRDQVLGWAFAFGGLWEVIGPDPGVPADLKARLRQDAASLAHALMRVGASGYDLEIPDADGRTTYHFTLHENAVERTYVPGIENGVHAMMALGIVGAYAYASGDPAVEDYLYDTLITSRALHHIARDHVGLADTGVASNYSNYHMAFQGSWLAHRYLCGDSIRAAVRQGLVSQLYDRAGASRQPAEQGQSFYDVVYVASRAGATAWDPMGADVDEPAIDRATGTLLEFAEPPYFAVPRVNCDDAEIAAGACLGLDGTPITLLGPVGRGGTLVAAGPVPFRIRPMSNYAWRSNPYEVNDALADGTALLSGADFRVAYWLGRWVRR